MIADANHRLLDVPDLGHVGPQFARARDQRLGGVDVVAGQRGARLPQPLSNLQQVHRGLRPLPHVARPRLFFVQRRSVVQLFDRRLVVAVREGALGRGEVLFELLRALARDALRFLLGAPAARRRPWRLRRRRVLGSWRRLALDRCELVAVAALHPLPHPRQVAVQLDEIRVAETRILLEGTGDHALDVGIRLRHRLAQERRRLLGDAAEHAFAQAARKRLAVRDQLEQHRAHREDVAAVIDRQPAHLLGRHVVEAADQRAGVRDAGIGQLRDAEVEDLQPAAAPLDHQVGRLDVAMDDPEGVRVGETVAQLLDELEPAGEGRGLPPSYPRAQRLAVDELHGDERFAVMFPDVEDADDVLVLEHAGGIRFLHEAPANLFVVDALLQDLDRERAAADLRIPGAPEGSHPTRPDRADDLVATDDLGRRHGPA